VPVLSDALDILFSSIVALTLYQQFLDCATMAFSDRCSHKWMRILTINSTFVPVINVMNVMDGR
jgi:hypothetical protein